MNTEIRCDRRGCTSKILVEEDITQYTASVLATAARWFVVHGAKRDFHYCSLHKPSLVAAVLRFAVQDDGRGDPVGIHTALRELDAYEVREAVWAAYYGAEAPPGDTPLQGHWNKLLEAANLAEEGA